MPWLFPSAPCAITVRTLIAVQVSIPAASARTSIPASHSQVNSAARSGN